MTIVQQEDFGYDPPMPRIARNRRRALHYHVFNRGINHNPLFRDDADRRFFTELVRRYKQVCGVSVYHWAWMNTHYHMLVEVSFDNLRPFAAGIQQAYAQHHHHRYGTCGVFWQGRYRSEPVEIGEYLVRCGRYIERNPVRGRLVEMAWDYPWSSAAFYVQAKADGVTDANVHIGAVTMTQQERKLYGQALMSGEDDSWIAETRRNGVIGSGEFTRALRVEEGRHRRTPGRPRIAQ